MQNETVPYLNHSGVQQLCSSTFNSRAKMPDLTQHRRKELCPPCPLCLLHCPSIEAEALSSVSDLVPSKSVQECPRVSKSVQGAPRC